MNWPVSIETAALSQFEPVGAGDSWTSFACWSCLYALPPPPFSFRETCRNAPSRTNFLIWVAAFFLRGQKWHLFDSIVLGPFWAPQKKNTPVSRALFPHFFSSSPAKPFSGIHFQTSHFRGNGAAWVTPRGPQPPVFTPTRCHITR